MTLNHVNEAREKLKKNYLKSFWAKISALQSLLNQLEQGTQSADAEIRKLAHQLHGSGTSYGYSEISEQAERVKQAPSLFLKIEVNGLIETLKRLISGSRTVVSHTSSYQLLLVEDNPEQVTLLQESLKAHCPYWELFSANSIEQAREILNTKFINAIILGILLTDDTDGRDFLMKLRENSHTRAMPVVVLSPLSDLEVQRECLSKGADLFITKPLDVASLAFSLKEIIERQLFLQNTAQLDHLTGLLNRGAFTQQCLRQMNLATRMDCPLSLAFLDIDHFKKINDHYGHSVGDEVLAYIGKLLKTRLRESDVAGRWGGEEFILLLPNTNIANASRLIHEIKDTLYQKHFGDRDNHLENVTFSGGIVAVPPDQTLEVVVEKADLLLYQAKASGRNCILVDGESDEVESRQHILVVDDDKDFGAYLSFIFGTTSFRMTFVEDGISAIEVTEKQHFDLILLDILLPGINGLTLLRHFKKSYFHKKTPVVMLTSSDSLEKLEQAFINGAEDYIKKPVNERELLARVKRFLK